MINIVRMLTIDEGLREFAYKDIKGKTTVGIGFNMEDVTAHVIWQYSGIPENFALVKSGTIALSKESAWKLLTTCVDNCKIDLRTIFTDFDDLSEGVQLALINLMFNMGLHTFSQFKQFIGLIKDGKYEEAAVDLGHTLWYKQVQKRGPRVMALLKEDDSLYN